MTDCCCPGPPTRSGTSPAHCPGCGRPGRAVARITLKALLRPRALMRLTAADHCFCATTDCDVVYFGTDETFRREDLSVPVFQKEPPGNRVVCYCFAVSESDITRDLAESGRSSAAERITQHIQQERCACEVRNPQGSCCLGNVSLAERALLASRQEAAPEA